jgi:hypothetical protein
MSIRESSNNLIQLIPVVLATLIAVGVTYSWYQTNTRALKKGTVEEEEQIAQESSGGKKGDHPALSHPSAPFEIKIMENESRIAKDRNVLLVIAGGGAERFQPGIDELSKQFFGEVVVAPAHFDGTKPVTFGNKGPESLRNKTVYLCGDISKIKDISNMSRVFIIQEYSVNYDKIKWENQWQVVGLGKVPINVHGVGILFRKFFDPESNYFARIESEHAFQSLTESTKPGTALRTGIYLTPVEKKLVKQEAEAAAGAQSENENGGENKVSTITEKEELHYRLLRCSTNLSGATGNFQKTDRAIVDALNEESVQLFENQAPLNHVLAQIYRNKAAVGMQKQSKAKIKDHSDKTKDMPENGVMAFVTFYHELDKLQPSDEDPFDYGLKLGTNKTFTSGLTTLYFRLKKTVAEQPGCNLVKHFAVTLSPGSVFFMPLSTNRIYTHEIRPAALDAQYLPTRMGYVVRCSDAEAVFKDGQCFMKQKGGGDAGGDEVKLVPLEPSNKDSMKALRDKYAEENYSADQVDYGNVNFSMNNGDYQRPYYDKNEEFRSFSLHLDRNVFHELAASAPFEFGGKGREGAVLVKPDPTRGVPIVRTSTIYKKPACVFNDLHNELASKIEEFASLKKTLNNCLIEKYTNEYATMGFHSDQALDLDDELNTEEDTTDGNNTSSSSSFSSSSSCIALFSCYENPGLVEELPSPPRKLVVEPKDPNSGYSNMEIPLRHNSVVVFSLECNKKFRHKIVLDNNAGFHQPENTWLGMTFRTSKTFIKYQPQQEGGPSGGGGGGGGNDEEDIAGGQVQPAVALFEDGSRLTWVTSQAELKEFYSLRSSENKTIDYKYPNVRYTISGSDLLPPITL